MNQKQIEMSNDISSRINQICDEFGNVEYLSSSLGSLRTQIDEFLHTFEKPSRLFPILQGGGVGIDWEMVLPHAGQAYRNHSQELDRLAERGGLSWLELWFVMHDRDFDFGTKMTESEARDDILKTCKLYRVVRK